MRAGDRQFGERFSSVYGPVVLVDAFAISRDNNRKSTPDEIFEDFGSEADVRVDKKEKFGTGSKET